MAALGHFLLGLLAGRYLLLQDVERNRPWHRRLLGWGLVLGVLGNGTGWWCSACGSRGWWTRRRTPGWSPAPHPGAGLPGAGRGVHGRLRPALPARAVAEAVQVLAPVGRMALTNYLLQSVVSPGSTTAGAGPHRPAAAFTLPGALAGCLRTPGGLQPPVAVALPLRPGRVAVALAHLRPGAAHASGARERHGFGGELTPESSTPPPQCLGFGSLLESASRDNYVDTHRPRSDIRGNTGAGPLTGGAHHSAPRHPTPGGQTQLKPASWSKAFWPGLHGRKGMTTLGSWAEMIFRLRLMSRPRLAEADAARTHIASKHRQAPRRGASISVSILEIKEPFPHPRP